MRSTVLALVVLALCLATLSVIAVPAMENSENSVTQDQLKPATVIEKREDTSYDQEEEPYYETEEEDTTEYDEEPEENEYEEEEEPKYEEPEEPKYEEPKYEEPKYEEPKYEEPAEEPEYSGGGNDHCETTYNQHLALCKANTYSETSKYYKQCVKEAESWVEICRAQVSGTYSSVSSVRNRRHRRPRHRGGYYLRSGVSSSHRNRRRRHRWGGYYVRPSGVRAHGASKYGNPNHCRVTYKVYKANCKAGHKGYELAKCLKEADNWYAICKPHTRK